MSRVRISPNLLNQPIKCFFDLLGTCFGNRPNWNMQWILECLLILIRMSPYSNYRSPKGNEGVDNAEDLIKVRILLDENKSFPIGTSMKHEDQVKVLLLFVQNVDVFAWSLYKVPGVDLELKTHRLNVDPSYHLKSKN